MDEARTYIVAVTRWGAALEAELGPISARLRLAPYDARLRLAGPIPVVVESTTDATGARELMAWLRERGHGVVGCDGAAVVASADMLRPRALRLAPTTLTCALPARELVVAFGDIIALVRASHERTTDEHTATTSRTLSLTRAALTGGLSFTKKEKVQRHEVASERERVLYVYRRGGEIPLLLAELGLRYDGLAERLAPTTAQNFETLVALLRERSPAACFDDRLVSERRRATSVQSTGTSAHGVIATSNAGATDLAAHLIALAHLRGQL